MTGKQREEHAVSYQEECKANHKASCGRLEQKIGELEHAEKAVAERLRFETLLSQLSTRFLNLPTSEVDREIELGLQSLAQFLAADRSKLFEFSEDKTHCCVSHLWTVAGNETSHTLVTLNQVPWVTAKMLRGEIFMVSHLDDLPDEATADREYLRQLGIKSVLMIPLAEAGSISRAVAFSSLGTERLWPEGVVQRMRLVGEIFTNALSHKQADESLEKSFQEIQALQQKLEMENRYLREEIKAEYNIDGIIGQSDVLKSVLFRVEQVASSDTTVLILGETGVGKGLIAQAIHQSSPRNARALVKVDCAALQPTLIESELFGHEKGAYTGATSKREGRFEVADGGTLFLDEIGELPLELQSKLLRVLHDGTFERVGSSRTISVDVRVIAATNRDLEEEVRNGRFRKDLYYRLQVFPISIPTLRKRQGDIPLLARFFVQKFARKFGKTIHMVPHEAIEALQNYSWPGNIRELENVIERAVINTQGSSLRLMDRLDAPGLGAPGPCCPRTLAESETCHIISALERAHWKIEGKDGAATALDVPPSTLRKRMQKHGISRAKES